MPQGVTQIRGISTTHGRERRRPRRSIIESVDRKRRATAYPTVSDRTRCRIHGPATGHRCSRTSPRLILVCHMEHSSPADDAPTQWMAEPPSSEMGVGFAIVATYSI